MNFYIVCSGVLCLNPYFELCRFATLLGQFNVQKFVEKMKKRQCIDSEEKPWVKMVGKQLQDKSLYALNFCAELILTSNDTLVFSSEANMESGMPRRKAIYLHEVSSYDHCVSLLGLRFNCRGLFAVANLD